MMKFKYVRNFFVFLALLSVVSLVSFKIGRDSAGVIVNSNGDKLDLLLMWKVRDRLDNLFLEKDKLVNKNMEYGAIQGMVASLGDPYTVFLPPTDNKSTNENLAGEFGGVGISLGYKDKTLAVMSPLPKTPAEKAGIKAGDLILKITDKNNNVEKDTNNMTLDEAVSLIRGKIGTEVTLKMFREGKAEAYDVLLKRGNILVPSIELEWKEQDGKKVAWVKLYKFTETLFDEWPEKVKEIKREKMNGNFGGIILDLRNNPGGFLQASVLVASDFIKEGMIVTQEASDGSKEKYDVIEDMGNLVNEKLVVLVNGGSASASEILAGALKDYNRAKLIGERSFGKGTVQQPEDFKDGSGLHVTVAKWLLPNGKNIHNEGVMPDVEVKIGDDLNVDLQLNKALELVLN
jgi:carboxyl-terminal processing protease